ncbi:MAG TPA: hypothetical protein VHD56_12760 [Tepidisphaeraceae bacterium]|nr:hypothetical protein [Tepidisphaeraceae bacterium]
MTLRKTIRAMLWTSLPSPRGWFVRAVIIILAFAVFHLLGWRDDTRFISGTSTVPQMNGDWTAIRGLIYAFCYFAAVIVAPIMLIAAGLMAIMHRLMFIPDRKA